jgi:membrane fusion protein (multidrug efflux system)
MTHEAEKPQDAAAGAVAKPAASTATTVAVAAPPPAEPSKPPKPAAAAPKSRRRWIIGAVACVVVIALAIVAAPKIERMLNTVSTDDAYVNGHVTFVAPRVSGQVTTVLVDDNNQVRAGAVLVQLDKEPYQIQLDLKQAALQLAKADLVAAQDQVRAQIAQARSNRYKLEHAIEDVENQVALLSANVAAVESSRAKLFRAQADLARAHQLQKTPGAISQQDVDRAEEAYRVADADVKQALEAVHQIRAGLGLAKSAAKDPDLAKVPPDLDQNFSTVRQALADLLSSAAPLGIFPSSYNATPKQAIDEFYRRDPHGNIDRIYAKVIRDAPGIKQAEARLAQAEQDLKQARLNLHWCDVLAEIDGVVTRRNVNPGNNLLAGQQVMAVRSLREIWVDANFKETQLANLRIGQRAELDVDMYGHKRTFEGRISGFTMGTGSTLALLPAENATGNFVKVVQRLPVRIEVVNYDPRRQPLFIGLSVEPHVFYKEPAEGPHAGEMLQPPMELPVEKLDVGTPTTLKKAP